MYIDLLLNVKVGKHESQTVRDVEFDMTSRVNNSPATPFKGNIITVDVMCVAVFRVQHLC